MIEIKIDGKPVVPTADHSLRVVETPAGPRLVLYLRGRRVSAPWLFAALDESHGDPDGGNANTA